MAGLVLAGAGAWLAVTAAGGGDGTSRAELAAAIERGKRLNGKNRHRRAERVLSRARDGIERSKVSKRVRATLNFELGKAQRGSGRFKAARKTLRRAQELGVAPNAVGVELAKARARIDK